MRKENLKSDKVQELPVRVTRSRATALLGSRPINKKRPLQTLPKKSSGDENADNAGLQHKRRAVLQNVTNVFCDNSYRNCFNASSIQAKCTKPVKKSRAKLTKVTPCVVEAFRLSEADLKGKTVLEREMSNRKQEEVKQLVDCFGSFPEYEFGSQSSGMTSRLQSPLKRVVEAEKGYLYKNSNTSRNPDVVDIDDQHDPQLCCVYAPDMYENLHVAELARRPRPDFMETIQRDITQSMRGILVDWLVEVSEEYKLVPDTLYLAVYLIDRFLSENYIERHRLQLIGVTCMLISSKYEEICAPRVEEFCFITDSTYTREEVLKMEVQILKYYNFQLFAPTAKSFLRRFLRAAQVSYTSPSLELEYLANYLAELTLVDYSFLNFLPSVIAASAIFLSRWTLDPTSHPWNPTLEYYTSYKSPDLKSAVIALQDLQLNTNGCPLSSIRTKYRNQRFKCVAALSSQKLPETLFLKTE